MMKRTLRIILLLLVTCLLVYLTLGFTFHVFWERALAQCRDQLLAQGEFAEPPLYGQGVRLLFDLVYWPVYARANMALDGTFFATPCTK